MRDLLVLGAMLAFVPMALAEGFVAYLLWGWAGLIALNSYVYGFMATAPLVQVFALIALVLLFTNRRKGNIEKFESSTTSTLLIIFCVHGLLSAILAYPDLPRNWELFGNLVKTVLYCLLMPMLLINRTRIHVMLVAIAMSISFHGALDGLKFLATGGSHRSLGISKFGDNNHFGLVLVMVLPVLYYLVQYSANRLVRLGFLGAMVLVLLAGISTNSRGALFGMVALAVWVILNSRRKLLGIVLVGMAASIVIALAPASWSERMQTVKAVDEDASFMGRVTAWKVSSAIAVANPVFGGGFRALQSKPVWDRFKYSPGLLGFVDTPILNRSGVAAHSIWFEVIGDLGIAGFLIFIAILINSFLVRSRIKKMIGKKHPDLQWAADLADLLAGSMAVYVTCGSLLSAAYFELPYLFIMLLEVLRVHVAKALKIDSGVSHAGFGN